MRRRRHLPKPTDRIRLGASGLTVSPFCLGMVGSPKVVIDAFEAGINFFFVTADMHWPYYEPLRRGLRALLRSRPGLRDEIVLAAACYPTQPEFNTMPFSEVTDCAPWLERIDVAVMGGSYAHDFAPRLPIYMDHRRQRLEGIRAIGATFHERAVVSAAVNHGLVDVAFVRYNPEHPGAASDVFPQMDASSRVPVYNFKSTWGYLPDETFDSLGLPADSWRPHISDYYRFALTPTHISGILCAPSTPRELRDMLDAVDRGPLSAGEQNYLINLSRLASGEVELAR